MEKPILQIKNLRKSFDKLEILKGISLDIYKGEFITLLGSSGCGKTTTLRAVAGLEEVDSGNIIINGEDVTYLEPSKRNVNTIFQTYALFPHMNVYDNIAYGPKLRKVPSDKIEKLVSEMLKLVQMEGYEKRMPNQLSGGQSQRIAIARALINRPDILLLDEPLGALDLKLRQHMQTELRRIQKAIDTTFIYVTHDQDEALNMSDRLAVMNEGVFEQVGSPEEIYNYPKTEFVARFVGERNIFCSKVINTEGNNVSFVYGGNSYVVPRNTDYNIDDCICLSVHADKVNISAEKNKDNQIKGTVVDSSYMGSQIKTFVDIEGTKDEFRVIEYNEKIKYKTGDTVYLDFDIDDCVPVIKNVTIN